MNTMTLPGSEVLRGQAAITEAGRISGDADSGLALRLTNESWRSRVVEAGRLFQRAYRGDLRAQAEIVEAMSRSDFPLLFGDFLGYTLGQRYADAPSVWQRFADRRLVRDFRENKVLDVSGARGILPKVPELAPYKRRAFTESEWAFSLGKYGAAMAWSWEAQIDDRLGVFGGAPTDFGIAAKRTVDYTVTSVLIDTDGSGPASWLGTPGTDALSRDSLEAAIEAITTATDEDGGPIIIGTPLLMVPPSLALTAQNIVNTTEIRTTVSGVEARVAGNGLSNTPEVVVNPWLTVIDQGPDAATTWYVLPQPDSPRPAVIAGFLIGNEAPDVRVRNDQGTRVGGGDLGPLEGSFDRDDIEFRVRQVVGASRGYDDAVFVSTGGGA